MNRCLWLHMGPMFWSTNRFSNIVSSPLNSDCLVIFEFREISDILDIIRNIQNIANIRYFGYYQKYPNYLVFWILSEISKIAMYYKFWILFEISKLTMQIIGNVWLSLNIIWNTKSYLGLIKWNLIWTTCSSVRRNWNGGKDDFL